MGLLWGRSFESDVVALDGLLPDRHAVYRCFQTAEYFNLERPPPEVSGFMRKDKVAKLRRSGYSEERRDVTDADRFCQGNLDKFCFSVLFFCSKLGQQDVHTEGIVHIQHDLDKN